MMANVPEFDIIGAEKFEDDAVGAIDPKAPDFVMLRMQLLSMATDEMGFLGRDWSWCRLCVESTWEVS
jgi:hypothetical protein